MKIRSIITGALLGTAALLLAGHSARAALTYSAGDLFLGFHQGDTSYLVNVGNVSLYSKLDGASFQVSTGGSIGPDLVDTFGDGWFNLGTVEWGAIGTTFNNIPDLNVIYASRERINPAVQSTPWTGSNNFGQSTWRSNVVGLSNKYKIDGDSTGLSSTKATVQSGSVNGSSTWASYTKTNIDFQLGTIEGKFSISGGTNGSVLDLYRIDPVLDQDATYLGSFRINNSGTVTYSAVPEPSTFGLLMGVGILLLILVRRRRILASRS